MASFNRVILMGNLTRDPELTYTNSDMAICKVGLAVNRRYKDSQSGEWKEQASFFDVTIFGTRGATFAKYHTKGRPAFVEGELRQDTWEDKQTGAKRSKVYVVANNWEFVGGREGGGREGNFSAESSAGQSGGGGYGGGGDGGGGGGGGYGSAPQGGGSTFAADDTPF